MTVSETEVGPILVPSISLMACSPHQGALRVYSKTSSRKPEFGTRQEPTRLLLFTV